MRRKPVPAMQEQELRIPDLGEEDTEGTVVSIRVAPGDTVRAGDILLEVETDKVVLEVPCPVDGVVRALLVSEEDTVREGTPYLSIETSVEEDREPSTGPSAGDVDRSASPDTGITAVRTEMKGTYAVTPAVSPGLPKGSGIAPAGPAARRLARELGVDIAVVSGTGRNGRISKSDVKAYVRNRMTAGPRPERPALPDVSRYGETERIPLTRIEQTSVRNMARSAAQIPHAWVQGEIDITDLEAARKAFREDRPDLPVTLTAILCHVLALALQEYPRFNAVLDEDRNERVCRRYIHIGVAVDTPRGLIVPCLRNVDELDIAGIAKQLKEVSGKAKSGGLKPDQLQGAGMTLTNLGGLGVTGILPIVNWPEVAILGVSAAENRPVLTDDGFAPRLIMPVTLGFDHRVINGADAARFLAFLKEKLESGHLLTVNWSFHSTGGSP